MAEHPDKRLQVRADTYDGWHTQLPNDSIFESRFGLISYSQSHQLSAGNYDPRQQDAVGYYVSDNLDLSMPIHLHHPMRWLQNPQSDNYAFPSIDSAHGGFGSDLEPTELEAEYGEANNSYIEAFKHLPALDPVVPSAFDSCSPISGLWSLDLLSHCTEAFS